MKGLSDGITVVVPVYNEEKIIEKNAEKILVYLEKNFSNGNYQLILSENGSTDNSRKIIRRLLKRNQISATFNDNKGIKHGIIDGFNHARFDIICFFPIDLSFSLDFIHDSYSMMKKRRGQVIIGSKGHKDSKVVRYPSRRVFSFLYNQMVSTFLGLGVRDSQGTLCFRKTEVKDFIDRALDDNVVFSADFLLLAARKGLELREIPVTVYDKRKDSKIRVFHDPLKAFTSILKLMMKRRG